MTPSSSPFAAHFQPAIDRSREHDTLVVISVITEQASHIVPVRSKLAAPHQSFDVGTTQTRNRFEIRRSTSSCVSPSRLQLTFSHA